MHNPSVHAKISVLRIENLEVRVLENKFVITRTARDRDEVLRVCPGSSLLYSACFLFR